jgi:hypothetical protein
MPRKRTGESLVGFGLQALTRYKPAQEILSCHKGENSYNNYLQRSKNVGGDLSFCVLLRNRRGFLCHGARAMCAPVLPVRVGGIAVDFFK